MSTEPFGLARHADRLPRVSEFVTLGEGNTPLLPLPRLAAKIGLGNVYAKMETVNPTGSYKDRVAAMSVSIARDRGCQGWIATSSGNAGLAMAAYGARAGLPGFVCLVASAPAEKLASMMPYGLGLVKIVGIGTGDAGVAEAELFRQVRAAARDHNLYLAVTAHAFNSEGMKGIDSIAYELAEQVPQVTHVYVPTGSGGLITAIYRGLNSQSVTAKCVACQATGCAPIVEYLNGKSAAIETAKCTTGVSALQLRNPPDGASAASAVIRSGGWGTSIDDEKICAAQDLIATTEGIFVEPAAATSVAALIEDVESGRLKWDDHPVVVLTGAGWKDLSRALEQSQQVPTDEVRGLIKHIRSWTSRHISASDIE
jgi:threonine synthase